MHLFIEVRFGTSCVCIRCFNIDFYELLISKNQRGKIFEISRICSMLFQEEEENYRNT